MVEIARVDCKFKKVAYFLTLSTLFLVSKKPYAVKILTNYTVLHCESFTKFFPHVGKPTPE